MPENQHEIVAAAIQQEVMPLPHSLNHGENLPPHVMNTPERLAMKHIMTGEETQEETTTQPQLENSEASYLQEHAGWEGLEQRYEDPRTSAEYVRGQINAFAAERGLTHRKPETAGGAFSRETLRIVQENVQKDIDRLLLDKEHGRYNPEKHKTVSEQTARYLALLAQAQEEGDVTKELSADDAIALVRENVWSLCYQDRVASENLLGDHGIRHLVGHNITTTETLFDELQHHGQDVKAIDRLMAHQVMIDHDVGYAMDPVREQVNAGNFKADRGHNILAAKVARQRATEEGTPFAKVFGPDGIRIMHQGILDHDSSAIDFQLHDTSREAREKNIHSAIHAADNSHAFEDKLPELLYSFPDTLKYMRLMKSAAETGDENLLGQLKKELAQRVTAHEELADDDKKTLTNAVNALTGKSYAFSVGRICGNKPELAIDERGMLQISVQESAIHQEVVGLFGQEELDQFRKFAADFTGKKKEEISLDVAEITGANVRIILRRAGTTFDGKTDYQRRMEALIGEETFRDYHAADIRLSARQKILEAHDRELAATLIGTLNPTDQDIDSALAKIREERNNLLHAYISQ